MHNVNYFCWSSKADCLFFCCSKEILILDIFETVFLSFCMVVRNNLPASDPVGCTTPLFVYSCTYTMAFFFILTHIQKFENMRECHANTKYDFFQQH